MYTAREDCIWFDQCGHDCIGRCEDFSPTDSSEEDTAFYEQILKENAEEYCKLIQEYSGEEETQFES